MAATFAQLSMQRGNNLDFVRFFLAACVAFTHSFNLLYGDNTDPLGVATGGAIGLAGEAVNGFFIISGFLITQSWQQQGEFVGFFKNRVLRIYPAFIIAVLFCTLLVAPLGSADAEVYFSRLDYWRVSGDMLLLKFRAVPGAFAENAFPGNVNGSLWTISYEFVCYLMVAALGVWGVFKRKPWLVLIFLLALALSIASHVEWQAQPALQAWLKDLQSWPRFIASFVAGMLFYLYRDRIPYDRRVFLLALLGFVFCTLVLRSVALATPVFGSYCLLYLAFHPRLPLKHFARRGDFSYGIYLYAFPVQQLLALYAGHSLNGLTMFVASILLSLLLAWLSWNLIEKPCLRFKSKKRLQSPVAVPGQITSR